MNSVGVINEVPVFTAPPVPEAGEALMPVETETFGQGLMKILFRALEAAAPELTAAMGLCLSLLAIVLLISLLGEASEGAARAVHYVGVTATGCLLLNTSHTMIDLASETVTQLSDYGKLLLPVMTAALAAEGGGVSSAGLYAATAAFDSILSVVISGVLVPAVYMYLLLCLGSSVTGEGILKRLSELLKSAMTWFLKTVLYVFTGFISITGVVSGKADAAALKAAKLTISGMVPVVGGILSDTSEAVLVGAGVLKNAAGVYGLLAIAAVWIAPFLKIGIQYLLLKVVAALGELFPAKEVTGVIRAFSTAMGLLLGMTGAVSIMLLISTVSFMKGVG